MIEGQSVAVVRRVRGLEQFQCLLRLPLHCNQGNGMDHNGTCDKMETLLRFDVDQGHTWTALQRWTGVYAGQASHWVWPEYAIPAKPRGCKYCKDDPERDARIAEDVEAIPRRPPPGPGQLSTKHGVHSRFAIKNARLQKGCSLS